MQAQQHAGQQPQQPQQQQQQPQRRSLRPTGAQTAAAAGLQQPLPVPAAQRGPEGVFADDDDDGAADAAAAAATAAAEQGAGAGTAAAMSDTLAALRLLAAQFPAAARAAGLPPIMLKAQLYSVVADRTAVDRELEDLRCAAVLDLFITSLVYTSVGDASEALSKDRLA